MERTDLENWFARHPDSIHTNAFALLDRCEYEIRAHAHRDAWIHAKQIAEDSLHRFQRIFGLPASDTFVTREVCHEVAREMKRQEPHPDDESMDWVEARVLGDLDPEARGLLREWLKELAEQEEHAAWREIVYFTNHLAGKLIERAHMTNRLDWDWDNSYPRVAARVARMMIQEFEAHVAEAAQPDRRIGGMH